MATDDTKQGAAGRAPGGAGAGIAGWVRARERAVQVLLVVFLGVAAYSNTFRVPFVLDDKFAIVTNPVVRDLGYFADPGRAEEIRGTYHGAWQYETFRKRYVAFLTFALNYKLHGFGVEGYHVVNLAIHLSCAVAVWWLVCLTFGTPGLAGSRMKDRAPAVAFFVAALFVSNPVQTQAVTYIWQRTTALSTLFFCLGIALYAKGRMSWESRGNRPARRAFAYYAVSWLMAGLAMKTKEIAFTMPLVITLYEAYFFEGRPVRRAIPLVPYFLILVLAALGNLALAGSPDGLLASLDGATRMDIQLTRSEYLMTQFRVIVTYIRLLVLPVGQTLEYDMAPLREFSDPQVVLSLAALLLMAAAGAFLFARSQSEPALRLSSFGIFWFFATLSIESSVFPVLDIIVEHRVYLPSIGFFTTLVSLCFYAVSRCDSPSIRRAAAIAGIVVVVAWGCATYQRNTVWQSDLSLWEDVVKKAPNNARARVNLGNAYMQRHRLGEAEAQVLAARLLKPDLPEIYFTLGLIRMAQADFRNACDYFGEAVRLRPTYREARMFLDYCRATYSSGPSGP